jgi:hypothetical protein
MANLDAEVGWGGDLDHVADLLEMKESLLTRYHEVVTGTNAMFLGIGGVHRQASELLWLLNRGSEAVGRSRTAAWYSRWWYRLLAMDDDARVELPLIGSEKTVVMRGRSEPSSVSTLVNDLVSAEMVGDQALRDLLLEWDHLSDSVNEVAYARVRINVWRSLLAGASDVGANLSEAAAMLGARPIQPAPIASMFRRGPDVEVGLIRSIVEGSQSAFDDAIRAAHDYHVAFYSSETVDGNPQNALPEVLINKPISVLVQHGVASGLDLNVSSPYFVDWSPWLVDLDPIAPEYEPG